MAKKAVFFRQNEVDIDEFARQFSEIKADQDDVFSVENGDKADFQDQTEFWRESESLKVQDDLFNHMAKFSQLFLSRIHERSDTVTEEKLGDTALTLSDVIDIGGDKIAVEDMVRLFERDVVRAQEADLAKPTFMALVPGSGHLLYSAAEYLASIAHIQCAARFTSSSACDIEESVVRWVAGIVGYPDECRGVLVSGSSMGVILAFSTARDYRLHGAHLFESAVVYMTEQAHLCNDRSLRVVGLGSCVYRCVPSLKHRMDPQQLDAMITKDKELGLTPFLIIATLGVTGTGAVDPFAEISEVAKKHDVWLHADAAIGGFLLLDEEIKERHKAVSLSDSITLDFHKAMSAPYGTAVVLVRDGVKLKTAMARGTAAYINNPGKWSEYAPIELSFEFTRPFRSFPIWFALKVLGTEPIKKQMTEKLKLTRYAYEVLSSNPHIQVYMEPDLCVLAFRTNFQNLRLSNLSTRKWHDLIVEEGAFYVSQTMAEGFFHNRMCILSFRTHIEAVDTALDSVQRTLDLLQKRYPLFSTKSTKGLKSFRRFKSYDEGIVVTPLRDKKFFKSIAE